MKISDLISYAVASFAVTFVIGDGAAFSQDLQAGASGCPSASGSNVCLTTFQGDNSRRGFNSSETELTQSAITSSTGKTFHKQYSTPLNGAVYAQPLVLPNVVVGSVTYADVAYVVTEQDAAYAIDASTGKIIWKNSLLPAGYTYLNSTTDLRRLHNDSAFTWPGRHHWNSGHRYQQEQRCRQHHHLRHNVFGHANQNKKRTHHLRANALCPQRN